jgi:hypothetical protein
LTAACFGRPGRVLGAGVFAGADACGDCALGGAVAGSAVVAFATFATVAPDAEGAAAGGEDDTTAGTEAAAIPGEALALAAAAARWCALRDTIEIAIAVAKIASPPHAAMAMRRTRRCRCNSPGSVGSCEAIARASRGGSLSVVPGSVSSSTSESETDTSVVVDCARATACASGGTGSATIVLVYWLGAIWPMAPAVAGDTPLL